MCAQGDCNESSRLGNPPPRRCRPEACRRSESEPQGPAPMTDAGTRAQMAMLPASNPVLCALSKRSFSRIFKSYARSNVTTFSDQEYPVAQERYASRLGEQRMGDRFDLQISFPDLGKGDAGGDAALLEEIINNTLRDQGQQPIAKQLKTDTDAADLGTLVEIVLGAPATIIVARGIAKALVAYFSRTNRSKIMITRPDGTTVSVTDAESRDIDKVAAHFSARP